MTLGSSLSESASINVILTKGDKAGFQRAFLGTTQEGACNTKFLSSHNGGGGGGGGGGGDGGDSNIHFQFSQFAVLKWYENAFVCVYTGIIQNELMWTCHCSAHFKFIPSTHTHTRMHAHIHAHIHALSYHLRITNQLG